MLHQYVGKAIQVRLWVAARTIHIPSPSREEEVFCEAAESSTVMELGCGGEDCDAEGCDCIEALCVATELTSAAE